MIDPTQMTEYGASTHRLEEIVLFSLCAANNNADTSAKVLEKVLNHLYGVCKVNKRTGPFGVIKKWYQRSENLTAFRELVRKFGLGKHTVKGRGIVELAHSGLDLKTCSTEELEQIHGISFKTSRFFILHTRPGVKVAALDTHILRYMRDQGCDTPRNTPSSGKKYRDLEKQFIVLANKSGRTIADFDLAIWNEYSGHKVSGIR